QSDQSVAFIHLSETRKLISHIHHSITVSWQKFSGERDAGAPSELADVVDHDGAHACGHNAAGHQQEFDVPGTGRALYHGQPDLAVASIFVFETSDQQQMAVRLPKRVKLFV